MIAVAGIFNLNACGQTSKDVPANIKTAFSKKFPKATKVKWEKENDKEWEAEFKINGKEYSANFNTNENWLETEYKIKKSEIPTAVINTLDNEFADYEIEETEISETVDGKVYEFELEKNETDMEVTIDPNGKVLKKEVKTEDDEKDND